MLRKQKWRREQTEDTHTHTIDEGGEAAVWGRRTSVKIRHKPAAGGKATIRGNLCLIEPREAEVPLSAVRPEIRLNSKL